MNRRPARLRLIYPVASAATVSGVSEEAGRFTFHLEEATGAAAPTVVALGIEAHGTGEGTCRDAAGRTRPFAWAWVGPQLHLWLAGDLFIFQRDAAPRRSSAPGADAAGGVLAPMPGAVLEVLVSEGERVERNQVVLLLESMKMELAVTAPGNAVVRRIAVQPGQQVERGMVLLELAPEYPASEP